MLEHAIKLGDEIAGEHRIEIVQCRHLPLLIAVRCPSLCTAAV
jgi:ABC-type enterobactin transport system permease subunit